MKTQESIDIATAIAAGTKYVREHITEMDTPENELKVKAYLADNFAEMLTYQVYQGDAGPTDICRSFMHCIFYLDKRRTGESTWDDERIGLLLAQYDEGVVEESDVYNAGEAEYIDLIRRLIARM